MTKFIVASRQATEMDQIRIMLEAKISEVHADCRGKAEVAAKAMDDVKELKNLVEELKADVIENHTHLDHLQKRNDEVRALIENAQRDVVKEFRVSSEFTILLDKNYAAGFEDVRLGAVERFPELTSALPNSTLVLQALSFRRALRMLILKMMPPPNLPKTSLILEIIHPSKRC